MWINFLSLLPSTLVTVLLITIAFLRFYDQTDFQILGFIAEPRIWSNRLTVAAIVATVANFGVDWYRRNRETNRMAQEEQRRVEEIQRRAEEERRRAEEDTRRMAQERTELRKRARRNARRVAQERAEIRRRAREEARRVAQERRQIYRELEARERSTRRARIETRCRLGQIHYQLEPNEANRQELINIIAILEEYGNTF